MFPKTACLCQHSHREISNCFQEENHHTQIDEGDHSTDREYPLKIYEKDKQGGGDKVNFCKSMLNTYTETQMRK